MTWLMRLELLSNEPRVISSGPWVRVLLVHLNTLVNILRTLGDMTGLITVHLAN